MPKTNRATSTKVKMPPSVRPSRFWTRRVIAPLSIGALLTVFYYGTQACTLDAFTKLGGWTHHSQSSPYGTFPIAGDPFQFVPCTNTTIPPSLDDPQHTTTWATHFDPNPQHWSWGSGIEIGAKPGGRCNGRPIFLCGYLDMPLDYQNDSDSRIVRVAITKLQMSGLARIDSSTRPATEHDFKTEIVGCQSERTIVLEPGGPGASGTKEVWIRGEKLSQRLSNGRYDVLGWDPRGVNLTLPSASCYTHDVYRDHWSLYTHQYREASPSHIAQLTIADSMNEAIFYSCWKRLGDLPRFISSTFAAHDLESIREALGENELSGYFLSYGSAIAQTYIGMYPDRVGRIVLDGIVYYKDFRTIPDNTWSTFDNVTDVWRDGFLGECIHAGPDKCALSQPRLDGQETTLQELQDRVEALIRSLITNPVPAYIEPNGPTLITYSEFVKALYPRLYMPTTWSATAKMLKELEAGNATAAANSIKSFQASPGEDSDKPFTSEVLSLALCADAHNSLDSVGDLAWWDSLWANQTGQSWLTGNFWFFANLPCRHFNTYWRDLKTFQGNLNTTLKNPVLIMSSTADPATPLHNSIRLFEEMGANARLVVHHGYGHSTLPDKSNCTDKIGMDWISSGELPTELISDCYANEKPYQYSKDQWV